MDQQLVYLNGEIMSRPAAALTLRAAGWSEEAIALFDHRARRVLGRELHPDVVAAWCRESAAFAYEEGVRARIPKGSPGGGQWAGGGGAFAPGSKALEPATALGKVAGLGGLARRAAQALGMGQPRADVENTPGGKWLKIADAYLHLDNQGKVDSAGPGRQHLLGLNEDRVRGLAAREGRRVLELPLIGSRPAVEAVHRGGLHDKVIRDGVAEVRHLVGLGNKAGARAVQAGLDRVRGPGGGHGKADAAFVANLDTVSRYGRAGNQTLPHRLGRLGVGNAPGDVPAVGSGVAATRNELLRGEEADRTYAGGRHEPLVAENMKRLGASFDTLQKMHDDATWNVDQARAALHTLAQDGWHPRDDLVNVMQHFGWKYRGDELAHPDKQDQARALAETALSHVRNRASTDTRMPADNRHVRTQADLVRHIDRAKYIHQINPATFPDKLQQLVRGLKSRFTTGQIKDAVTEVFGPRGASKLVMRQIKAAIERNRSAHRTRYSP